MVVEAGRPAIAPRRSGGGPARIPRALVDLLATPYGTDRYLELVAPLAVRDAIRDQVRARVVTVRQQTSDATTLTLRVGRGWQGFRAGQFVQVGVEVDGVLRTRCYSPVGSEHGSRRELELTVTRRPGGRVSPVLADARPGMLVRLSAAQGDFTLPAARPDQLLLISGGSGITPVLSMLRTLADEGHRGRIAFLHYADDAADVPYRDELLELRQRVPDLTVVLAYTTPGAGGDLPGLFGADSLARAVPWYPDAETYLCGPAGLTEAVTAHYGTVGLPARLHVERFTPARPSGPSGDPPPSPDSPAGTVTFTRSGAAVPNDGSTLLELAERAGLDAGRGCGMGICFSCVQVKHAGRVRNLLTGADHDDPDTQVQTCIGVPVGDVDLDL